MSFLGLILVSFLIVISDHVGGLKAPEIKVLTWVEGENTAWRDDVSLGDQEGPVHLVNRSTYILTNEVLLIFFLCTAPYPTEWEFPHGKWIGSHQKVLGGVSMTSRRIAKDMSKPKTYKYWSQLAIFGDSNLFTGDYICRKADDFSVQSNMTVFWEGGPLDFETEFVLSGSNLTIWMERSDRIVFPCYVRDPYVEVVLLQDIRLVGVNDTRNDTWVEIPLSSKLTYKPEVGFIFQKRSNDLWMDPGLYKCSTKDGTDSLLLNFVPEYEDTSPLMFNGPITTTASLERISTYPTFECCSNSLVPPKITVISCTSPAMCNMLIHILKTDPNKVSRIPSPLGKVITTNGSCTQFTWTGGQGDLFIARCVGDGIDVIRKYFMRNPQNLSFSDWSPKALEKWIQINIKPKKPLNQIGIPIYQVYAGHPTTFDCRAPSYFFSYGIRWTLNYKDGSMTTLPDTLEEVKYTPIFILLPTTTIAMSVTINVTKKDVDTLTCHVPVANTSEWVTKSLKLSLKESIPAAIEGVDAESFFWVLNETNKFLTCKISGDPEPNVLWTKDDKAGLSLVYNISRHHDGTFVLQIPLVTHEIQGEYKCIAINFAGRSEKSFVIFVEESQVTQMTTTIIATLVILLLFIGGVFIIKKTLLQKKSLENLRESVNRTEQS